MKIDLTKREWEFFKEYCNNFLDCLGICQSSDYLMFEILNNKLSNEWIDEEEEMRKFHMGFAYKPKEKNETKD